MVIIRLPKMSACILRTIICRLDWIAKILFSGGLAIFGWCPISRVGKTIPCAQLQIRWRGLSLRIRRCYDIFLPLAALRRPEGDAGCSLGQSQLSRPLCFRLQRWCLFWRTVWRISSHQQERPPWVRRHWAKFAGPWTKPACSPSPFATPRRAKRRSPA